MPNTCPNTNIKEWRTLRDEIGYASAMRAYELNGESIPTVEEARALFEQKASQTNKYITHKVGAQTFTMLDMPGWYGVRVEISETDGPTSYFREIGDDYFDAAIRVSEHAKSRPYAGMEKTFAAEGERLQKEMELQREKDNKIEDFSFGAVQKRGRLTGAIKTTLEYTRSGRTQQSVVEDYSVAPMTVNEPSMNPALRSSRPIGFTYDTKQVARERFDFSKLEKIGSGSDRDVFDLGGGMVLKVAKTARGLEQNSHEGEGNYMLSGVMPQAYEVGANYVVAEKVDRAKAADKVKTYDEEGSGNETGEATVGQMLAELKKFSQQDMNNSDGKLQDVLNKYGLIDILNYNVLWNDFTAIRNWGYKDGTAYHIDGGTFGGEEMIKRYTDKSTHRNIAPLSDPEFRKIYYESKRLKKQHGDTDKHTRYQTEDKSVRTITEQSAKFIQKLLSKVFPGVKVEFLSQAEYNERFGTDTRAVVGPDGVVYYNRSKISASTQVHEFGHVWVSWAKRYAPRLYQQGMKLAADSAITESIQRLYPGLQGNALYDEVLATLIGEQGAVMVEELLEEENNISFTVARFFSNLWNSIKNYVNRKLGKDVLHDEFYAENLSQFVQKVGSRLVSGQMLSDITSEEIADIESDLGITRAQIYTNTYEEEYHENNYGAKEERIFKPRWLTMEQKAVGDLSTSFNHQMRNDPAFVADPNIALGTYLKFRLGVPYLKNYFGYVFGEIEKGLNRSGGNDNPANKAFSKALAELRDAMYGSKDKNGNITGEIDDELAEIAEHIVMGTFNRKNLSKGAKRVWISLVDHLVQQQNYAANMDDILLNDDEKITKEEQQKVGQQEISSWRTKVEAYKAKNKYLKKVLDFVEDKYLMKVASGPLWTMMMSGKKTGMIWQLGRAIGKAVGKQAAIENNANHHLINLLEADWLKGGSQSLNPMAKLKDLEKEDFNGVALTTEEQFHVFMVLQQDNVRVSLLGGSKSTDKSATFYVEEFANERTGQEVKITFKDYMRLKDKFDSHWEEVRDTWGNASEYIYDEANKVFKLENGVRLSRAIDTDPNKRWNIYFPLVHGKGADAIKTYMKDNRFVNAVASHKFRAPNDEEMYYAGKAFKVMDGYIRDNAQYAAFAMPIRNMNVFIRNNEKFLVDNGMKHYIEWWNKTERHMFNGDQDALGEIGKRIVSGFVVSRLGLNPFVDMKQFTSVPLATTTIPTKYILKSQKELFGTLTAEIKNYDIFTTWLGKDKQIISLLEEMKNHSSYALARIVGGTNEVQKYLQDGFLKNMRIEMPNGRVIQLQSQDFLKNIKTMDTAVGAMIWNAAKLYVEKEMNVSANTEEYWKAVDDIYTQAVTEAQSSIDEWNRPYFAKDGNILNRALSLFAGQSFASFNGYLMHMIEYLDNPNPRTLTKMCQSFMNVFVVSALMTAAVDTFRYSLLSGGGDDKDHDEKFREAFFKGFHQNIPIVSPIVDAVYSKYSDPVWGRELSYPIFEVINSGASVIASAIKGKEGQAIEEMTYFGAGMVGIPTTPIRAAKTIVE